MSHHNCREHIQYGGLQIVVEGAMLLMLGDEVVMCLRVLLDNVCCYETLETLVSHVRDL